MPPAMRKRVDDGPVRDGTGKGNSAQPPPDRGDWARVRLAVVRGGAEASGEAPIEIVRMSRRSRPREGQDHAAAA